jgi:inhibitor of cysteine peptidase
VYLGETLEQPKRLVLRVGEELQIELPSNPTAGYLWEAHVDHPGLQVKDSGFRLEGSAVGAGGKQILGVEATAKGEYIVRLAYKRPWETDSVREAIYVVTATAKE